MYKNKQVKMLKFKRLNTFLATLLFILLCLLLKIIIPQATAIKMTYIGLFLSSLT